MRAVLFLLALTACGGIDLTGLPGALEGRVVDAATGEPIAGARLEAVQWPRVYGEAVIANDQQTWYAQTDDRGAFAFDPYDRDGFHTGRSIPAGRTRFRLTAPGYDTAVFYRDLAYRDACRSERRATIGCQALDLDLLPTGTDGLDLLPDVMVDASTVADCRLEEQDSRTLLRVSTGTPNTGRGPVELTSEIGSQEVRQVIHESGGGTHEVVLEDAAFLWEDHEDHNHFHFENWSHLRLLDSAGWLVGVGQKISFCLIDLADYDAEIYREIWGNDTRYNCYSAGNTIHQGLSPGKMDVYSRGLEGQWVDVTDVPPGQYRLEVEVDPLGFLHESDTTNNKAQVVVNLPAYDVPPDYNPCQPEHLQEVVPGDVVVLDTTGRDALTLGEHCDAQDIPTLADGAYHGSMDGLRDDVRLGDGVDGVFRVEVGAGQQLRVAANMVPGDVMIGLTETCGQMIENRDAGWAGQSETLTWTNTEGAPRTLIVVIDNYEIEGTGDFILDITRD